MSGSYERRAASHERTVCSKREARSSTPQRRLREISRFQPLAKGYGHEM
jgi:hypothetical protein